MDAPANLSAFRAALSYYRAHGCDASRMAVGLLTGAATSSSEATALLHAATDEGAMEIDFWANLWAQPEQLDVWEGPLSEFIDADADAAPPMWVWAAIGVAGVMMIAALLLARCRHRRFQRATSAAALGSSLLPRAAADGGSARSAGSARSGAGTSVGGGSSRFGRRMSSRALMDKGAAERAGSLSFGPSLMSIGSGT